MDAQSDQHGCAADEFGGFPPLAQAGAGQVFGFAAVAAPPLPVRQPDAANGAGVQQLPRPQVRRVKAQLKAQAEGYAIAAASIHHRGGV